MGTYQWVFILRYTLQNSVGFNQGKCFSKFFDLLLQCRNACFMTRNLLFGQSCFTELNRPGFRGGCLV